MAGKLTTICDREGHPLAKALVPESWLTGGEKFVSPGAVKTGGLSSGEKAAGCSGEACADDSRILAAARAINPDGSATMFVQTGEEFLEVIKGAGLDQKHDEDKVDPYFGVTMQRYLLKNDYLDKIAQALAGGAGPLLVAETDIPMISGQSAEEYEETVRDKARRLEEWLESGGAAPAYWDFRVKHLLTAHPVRQYAFNKDGQDKTLIIAADIYAYDFDLAGSGTGALSGLPGGLFGKGTGSYILWGSGSLAAVIADADQTKEARQAFYRYAASFRWC